MGRRERMWPYCSHFQLQRQFWPLGQIKNCLTWLASMNHAHCPWLLFQVWIRRWDAKVSQSQSIVFFFVCSQLSLGTSSIISKHKLESHCDTCIVVSILKFNPYDLPLIYSCQSRHQKDICCDEIFIKCRHHYKFHS